MPGRLFGLLPLAWLAVFLGVPLLLVLKISVAESAIAQPPYGPVLSWSTTDGVVVLATLDSYRLLVVDHLYLAAYLSSVKTALVAAFCCAVIGLPIALAIARARGAARVLLLALAMLPFLTSFLIRTYAWKLLLQGSGPLNAALVALGIVERPIAILYTDFAVYVGIVYAYLPFMVLPQYAVLSRLDPALLDAAADLGCPPWRAFATVTLPLAAPGLAAGAMLVGIPAIGEFVIPEMLGGPDSLMIGRVLWTEFFANRDWPAACAVAAAMLALCAWPVSLVQRYARRAGVG